MIVSFVLDGQSRKADLGKPLDISIPMRHGPGNVNAWYIGHPRIEPHREGDFTGSVREGGSTNFNDIYFNPHAHVTHTECLGHITPEGQSVNTSLNRFFYHAKLITIAPEKEGKDRVISRKQLERSLGVGRPEALIVRTLPNTREKLSLQYSHTNPPYFTQEGMLFLVEKDIQHLLVDLPSVDKEKDGGALLAHKAFWCLPDKPRIGATITEFVYASHQIKDGEYLLELQVAPIENDASPSRPVLYELF